MTQFHAHAQANKHTLRNIYGVLSWNYFSASLWVGKHNIKKIATDPSVTMNETGIQRRRPINASWKGHLVDRWDSHKKRANAIPLLQKYIKHMPYPF